MDDLHLHLVHRNPLFTGLRSDQLQALCADSLVRSIGQGGLIFQQGDPPKHFFVVLSGWVKLTRHQSDGVEVVIEIFGPGESFAEGAINLKGGYPVTAEMIEAGEVLAIPASAFFKRLREDPDLAVSIVSALSTKLKLFVLRIESANRNTAPQRVAEFLLKFCPAIFLQTEEVVVDLPYDKHLIAARLGMKPETFSRSLNVLRRNGVSIDGRRVSIRDVAELQRFVVSG